MFPMKMIEDYKIFNEKTPEKIEKKVKEHLAKNWVLLGSVQITPTGNYIQVVIKVAEQ
jgi:hypothetical protein